MNNQNPLPTPARRVALIKISIKASSAKINNLLKNIKATSELHNFKLARVQTVRGYDNSASLLLTEEIERDASRSAIAQELLRMLLRQQEFFRAEILIIRVGVGSDVAEDALDVLDLHLETLEREKDVLLARIALEAVEPTILDGALPVALEPEVPPPYAEVEH